MRLSENQQNVPVHRRKVSCSPPWSLTQLAYLYSEHQLVWDLCFQYSPTRLQPISWIMLTCFCCWLSLMLPQSGDTLQRKLQIPFMYLARKRKMQTILNRGLQLVANFPHWFPSHMLRSGLVVHSLDDTVWWLCT